MLTKIKNYFKAQYGWKDSISIGKIDNNRDKAICIYTSNTARAAVHSWGGKSTQSHIVKPVTILLRYGKAKQAAEDVAQAVFDFFDESQFTIDGRKVFALSDYGGPIDLGTDESGVYEYSIELNFYFMKE